MVSSAADVQPRRLPLSMSPSHSTSRDDLAPLGVKYGGFAGKRGGVDLELRDGHRSTRVTGALSPKRSHERFTQMFSVGPSRVILEPQVSIWMGDPGRFSVGCSQTWQTVTVSAMVHPKCRRFTSIMHATADNAVRGPRHVRTRLGWRVAGRVRVRHCARGRVATPGALKCVGFSLPSAVSGVLDARSCVEPDGLFASWIRH